MLELLRSARAAVTRLPDDLRTTVRLTANSGMLGALTARGALAMGRAVLQGSQNPSHVYRVHAANTPAKMALLWRDRSYTWAALDREIDRLAAALVARGFGPGQSLVLMMRNRPELLTLNGAAGRTGTAAVAASWRSTPQELAYLVNHSGARGIALEPESLPVFEAIRAEVPRGFRVFVTGHETHEGTTALEDLRREVAADARPRADAADGAVVIYTSGTTGRPKGAVRKFPKASKLAMFRFLNETPLRVDDVHLVACPLYHSTAFGFLTLSQVLGCTSVLMDNFEPIAFLEAVERHAVTTSAVVPTMLHRLLEVPRDRRRAFDTSSLRAIFSVGAPLSAPLASAFMDAFGDVLFNLYGATETGFVTLASPRDLREAPGTVGRAVPGNVIRLLSERGAEVGPGDVGELFVKNDLLVAGYHKDERATEESMNAGYFSVGDLARRDPNGRYFIEGRKRDMIISGGVNVYPVEIEATLEAHPQIAEVAVVGVPDPEWGERVCAFVVGKPGASLDPAELAAFARARLSGAKVPRSFVALGELPRNATGKVLKRDLRERAARPSG